LIALQKVGAEIYTSEAHKSEKLWWLERMMVMAFRCLQEFEIFMKIVTGFFVIDAFLDIQVAPQARQ
jgi:hypothetical protein